MVYNTREYWVFGLCPPSDILKKTSFRKLDLFPSSGEGMGDTYSVGFVRKSWYLPLLHLRTETDLVSETLCYLEEWYSTFFVRVPPDIISLQLCTPEVVGV
jgi:hypothetical protein